MLYTYILIHIKINPKVQSNSASETRSPSQRFPATLVSSASFSSRCGTIRRRLQRIFSFSWSQWCAQETTESGMETGLTFKLSNQPRCYWKKKRTSIQRFRLISLWIALPRAQYIMFVGGIWHVTNSCWIMLYLIKLLRSLEVLSDWRIISESPELRYNRLNKVVKLCQTYMKCLTHAQWQQLSNPTECQKSLCHFDPGADFQDHMSMSSTSNWPRNICQGLPRSKLLQDATWEGMEEGRGDVTSTVPGNMLRWGILKRGKTQWTMGHWGTLCGETNPKMSKKLVTVSHCHETNLPQALSALSTRVFGESESKRGAGSEDVLLNPKKWLRVETDCPSANGILSQVSDANFRELLDFWKHRSVKNIVTTAGSHLRHVLRTSVPSCGGWPRSIRCQWIVSLHGCHANLHISGNVLEAVCPFLLHHGPFPFLALPTPGRVGVVHAVAMFGSWFVTIASGENVLEVSTMVHWVRVHWMNPDWKSILKNEGPLPSWLLEIPVMDYDHPGKKPTNNQPTGGWT